MSLHTGPAGRHRAVTAGFTARVRGVSDWNAPAPVPGWRARDVVGHQVEWFPEFLKSATGICECVEVRRVAPWHPTAQPPRKPVGGTRRLLLVFRRPCKRTRRWYP